MSPVLFLEEEAKLIGHLKEVAKLVYAFVKTGIHVPPFDRSVISKERTMQT